MTLTISPAVAEHIDGPTVIKVVEGERRKPPGMTGSAFISSPGAAIRVPPAELVALRDARCETCKLLVPCGDGMVIDRDGGRWVSGRWVDRWEPFRCPSSDCHDGRKLVEVRVPCNPATCELPRQACSGHVSLHGLIDVVSVVCCDDHHAGRTPKGDAVVVGCAGGQPLLWREERAIYEQLLPAHVAALEADLGRPIAPGDLAVVFKAVEL